MPALHGSPTQVDPASRLRMPQLDPLESEVLCEFTQLEEPGELSFGQPRINSGFAE
jgi:hypothetical protein